MRELTISPSKLSAFVECPQKFALEYLQHERPEREQSLPMAFGTFVHAVFERFVKEPEASIEDALAEQFIESFGRATYADVITYSATYESACEDTLRHGKSIGKHYRSPSMTGYFKFKHGDKLARMFVDAFGLEDVNPYQFWSDANVCVTNFEKWFKKIGKKGVELMPEVEHDVVLPFRYKGVQFRFNGVIDLLIKDGDAITVIDYKTNQSQYSEDKSDFSLQLGLYAMVVEQFYNIIPRVGFFEARLGKYTTKTYNAEKRIVTYRCINNLLRNMVDFILDYETNGHPIEGKSPAFYLPYASRFPLMAASMQGCPCRFLEQCVFKRPV